MTAILSIPSSPELGVSHIVDASDHQESAEAYERENTCVVERCHRILSYYEEESQKPGHETARWLVEQLSEDQQTVAANCSYAYWFLSTLPQQKHGRSIESARFATAMQEAIRHMNCADDRYEVLRLLRATADFHATNKTHMYRTCMTDNNSVNSPTETLDDVFFRQKRKDRIHDEMTNYQANVVRGHDKEDRAIFFAFPRKQSGKADSDSEQAFVDSIVYTLERALACAEFRSVGRQDQLFCVVDTKGGSCPPFKTLQAAVGVMQRYYPNRLKHCVVLNAPYILAGIWKMLKPFLDPVTASKFVFPSSKATKKPSPISELIDDAQAMPVLMPGRGELDPDVDIDRFLYEIPFYKLYDDVQRPKVMKLRSPTESTSTASMSMTDSSSTDSGRSNKKTKRRSSFFRELVSRSKQHQQQHQHQHHQQQHQHRKPKDKLDKVSVRSLATGALAMDNLTQSPLSSSNVVINKIRVHTGAFSNNKIQ